MTYTPINWQTGDTITAEKLNKMDNGWGAESTELFSETVMATTIGEMYRAQLTYSQLIDADSITVTFDGTEYTCPRDNEGGYGAPWPSELDTPDFSGYPFRLESISGRNRVYTQTVGEHTIAVAAQAMQTSADFAAAVTTASPIDASLLPFRCVPNVTTYAEMEAAADAGRLLYFYVHSTFHLVVRFQNESSDTAVTAYPEGVANVETYGFDSDMVFSVFTY